MLSPMISIAGNNLLRPLWLAKVPETLSRWYFKMQFASFESR